MLEQPQTATSGKEQCVKDPGVVRVVGPMHRWGLHAEDRRTGCVGFVRKPTAWLARRPGLGEILEGWCMCASEDDVQPYRPVQLVGGLAAPAAQYPIKLMKAILQVMREDLRQAEELSDLAACAAGPSPHEIVVNERCADQDGVFVDDVCGGMLDAEKVQAVRCEEGEWCRKMGVWMGRRCWPKVVDL